MEGCGRTLDDEKEKEAMKDSGLGTPATRAGIIELLLARHYVERNGRSLIPTPKGLEIYGIVKEKMIANVSMTGKWECALHEIETGEVFAETFTGNINSYARQITFSIFFHLRKKQKSEACRGYSVTKLLAGLLPAGLPFGTKDRF